MSTHAASSRQKPLRASEMDKAAMTFYATNISGQDQWPSARTLMQTRRRHSMTSMEMFEFSRKAAGRFESGNVLTQAQLQKGTSKERWLDVIKRLSSLEGTELKTVESTAAKAEQLQAQRRELAIAALRGSNSNPSDHSESKAETGADAESTAHTNRSKGPVDGAMLRRADHQDEPEEPHARIGGAHLPAYQDLAREVTEFPNEKVPASITSLHGVPYQPSSKSVIQLRLEEAEKARRVALGKEAAVTRESKEQRAAGLVLERLKERELMLQVVRELYYRDIFIVQEHLFRKEKYAPPHYSHTTVPIPLPPYYTRNLPPRHIPPFASGQAPMPARVSKHLRSHGTLNSAQLSLCVLVL